LREGTPLTAAEISAGISIKAALSWFKALKDLSECQVTCKIALGSKDTEATALILPQAQYTVKVTPALAIDVSQMVLDGLKLVGGPGYGLREREVPRNTASRVPTGGLPSYTYRSADPAIASVDGTGKVAGLKNGLTTIVVTDAANQQVSYPVRVSNVYRLLLNDARMNASEANAWLASVGAARIDNSGQPLGWGILESNFVDITPIYGGRGLYYLRFISLNLSYPSLYVIGRSLFESNGIQGAGNWRLIDPSKGRAMAYIPN
jgi:hypothetical protein